MKNWRRLSVKDRLVAGFVFAGSVVLVLVFRWALAGGKVNLTRIFGVCGFKQKYGLPCPSCGMTHAVVAFVQGRIRDAFYLQPAAAIVCCAVVVCLVWCLLAAITGRDFGVTGFFERCSVKYVILTVFILLAVGWAFTLLRTLAGG